MKLLDYVYVCVCNTMKLLLLSGMNRCHGSEYQKNRKWQPQFLILNQIVKIPDKRKGQIRL